MEGKVFKVKIELGTFGLTCQISAKCDTRVSLNDEIHSDIGCFISTDNTAVWIKYSYREIPMTYGILHTYCSYYVHAYIYSIHILHTKGIYFHSMDS